MKAIRNNIPNAITSLNLLFGCLACIAAFHCSDTMCGTDLKGYQWAFIFIALAAVADFFDGLVARLLHAVRDHPSYFFFLPRFFETFVFIEYIIY